VRTLLIADDEGGIRTLVRMTLESDTYEILEASDGDAALQLARDRHPDLVLLDVSMPKRNGLEVCHAIKEDPATSDIAVVMLTARAQESDRRLGEDAGVDAYFTKPFSPVQLMDLVESIYNKQATA
jgi:two-component system, OmpR family, alkaline phosphatase synthesis response regulator PhoP